MSKGLVRSGPDLFSVKSAKHRAEKFLMPQKNFKKNILCIGAGYVGGPTMTIIANKCSDYYFGGKASTNIVQSPKIIRKIFSCGECDDILMENMSLAIVWEMGQITR